MATTVLEAVKAHYGDSDLPDLVPTALALGEVPEREPLPWVVAEHLGEDVLWQSERRAWEKTRLVFHCFAETAEAADTIAEAVKEAFDLAELSMTGRDFIACRRTRYTLAAQENRSPSGENVFCGTVEFKIEAGKTV